MKLLTVLTASVLVAGLSPAPAQDFVSLFNGKDFSGWKTRSPDHRWVIENGVIDLKAPGDGKGNYAFMLFTERTYGDFILNLEFKVPDDVPANSGVFLRTSDLMDPVQNAIEVNVTNYKPGGPLTRTSLGSLFDLAAPTQVPYKAAAWNRMVITCRGSGIAVALNGETVTDVDLDQWREARKNPDGTPNKFRKPLKEFARTGNIGLQDHGRIVSYRNIRIRLLPSVVSSGL